MGLISRILLALPVCLLAMPISFTGAFSGMDGSATPPATMPEAGAAEVHMQASEGVEIAIVNGVSISLKDLMDKMSQIRAVKFGNNRMTKELGDQLKKQALEKLITEEIIYQEAIDRQVQVTEQDVEACVASERGKHRDEQHFQKYLQVIGMDEEKLLQQCRKYSLMQKLVDQVVNSEESEVDMELARQIYERNKAAFTQEEVVQVTDLMFFFDPSSPESIEKAEQVRKKMIEEYDGDAATLPESPDYYVVPDTKLDKTKQPVLYEMSRVLTPYEVSEVLHADGTLHVVRLTGYRPRVEKSFEDVLPQLKGKMLSKQREDALNKFLAKLRRDAKVEIKDTDVN